MKKGRMLQLEVLDPLSLQKYLELKYQEPSFSILKIYIFSGDIEYLIFTGMVIKFSRAMQMQ